ALRYPLDRAVKNEPSELVALTTTTVMGVFSVIIQVCMIGGIALGLPFVLYHFSRFVAPGLTEKEKRVLVPACAATFVLFVLGCLFSYFMVLPVGLEMTLLLNKQLDLGIIWTAQSYYSLVVWMMVGAGLAFEFPLVLILLQYIGVVTPQQLREHWRVASVLVVVASAFLTPADPISTIMLGVVLFLFYLGSIYIGARLVRKRDADIDAYLDGE
ncbi:MAG: twin-arginine translocase subunit TatC, partial [Puniceicoccales bacterium]